MATTAYLDSKKIILDSVKCRKGKPCGEICIPKSSECNVDNPNIKSTKKKTNNAGRIIAGVGIGSTLGSATVAAGLGVFGAAELHRIKKNYQANFAASAVRAEAESKTIKAPDLDANVKTAILTVGGFGTKDAYSESEALKKNIESLGVKGLYVEPQRYAEFNVPTEPKDKLSKKQAHEEAKNLFIKTVVKTGYNPVAVTVAAKIIAYKKANPDKEYQLMGHSGGGLVVQEAHEILHKAGIQIKTTAIGSPDVGLIPGTGDLVTATSKQDNILKLTGGRGVNAKKFDNVPAHGQNSYFADNDFRNFIKDRLTPTRKDRFDKATCKIGKNCGDICIPKKSVCKSETQSSVSGEKLKTSTGNKLAVTAGITAGAAIAGLPVAAYLVQKARFQAGFSKSAELAKEQAKTYKVPEKVTTGFRAIDDQQPPNSTINSGIKSIDTGKPAEQITFFAGGIAALNGLAADHIGQQVGKMLPEHHVVAIETPEQDVPYKPGDSVGSPSYIKKAADALLKDNIRQGRSQVAVRIAARAYAYNQAHPDLPINLIGHSGGGMPVRESAEILKRMGVKDVKVVTAGSPYFGLTPPVGLSLIDSKNDPVDKIYGKTMPNKTQVETPGTNGHSFYFAETAYKLYKPGSLKYELATDIWDSTVVNKSTQKVLNNYFDRNSKKQQKVDSRSRISFCNKYDSVSNNSLRQIQKQFSILLSRAYGKAIAKIGGLKVSLDNTVTGMAQDVTGKILNFTFKDEKITYELAKKTARMDSADIWQGLITNYREDKSVKKKCRKGLTCGDGCIAANDTCRLKLNQIASPSEISRLRQSIVRFKLEQNQSSIVPVTTTSQTVTETVTTEGIPVKPNKYVVNPETGTPYTIRELRKQASEKRIYGYGSMTIKELQGTLQLYDQKPESRDRITRGITKRKGFSARAIAVSGLSGRGTPLERTTKRNLKNTADTWRKLEALAKFASKALLLNGVRRLLAHFCLDKLLRTTKELNKVTARVLPSRLELPKKEQVS